MPIRARATELKANAHASLKRVDLLIAQVHRSLNRIEARLLDLRDIRRAPSIQQRDVRH
jgi:hypothetical protein